MSVLEDILAKLEMGLRYNSVMLTQQWQWLQKREADKTADDWVATTAYVPPTTARQILGHNAQRANLTVTNGGTVSVALCNRYFDDNEAAALDANETAEGVYPFLVLPSSGTITIPTRGAVYALSLSGTGSVLSVVETVFSTPVATWGSPPVALGQSGAAERGVAPDASLEQWHRSIV